MDINPWKKSYSKYLEKMFRLRKKVGLIFSKFRFFIICPLIFLYILDHISAEKLSRIYENIKGQIIKNLNLEKISPTFFLSQNIFLNYFQYYTKYCTKFQ